MPRRPLYACFAAVALGATVAHGAESDGVLPIAQFSKALAGESLPEGWEPYIIRQSKPRTVYRIVAGPEGGALEASADKAASGLTRKVRLNLREYPVLEWRWRIDEAPAGADLRHARTEDAAARIVLLFEGDSAKLSVIERTKMVLAKTLSDQKLPYATLMYVWSDAIPADSVVANPHTSRIQMIVANRGAARAGQWSAMRRNVREDFRRAFGEEPGALFAVGVLTDADNTGSTARACYGDITFRRE